MKINNVTFVWENYKKDNVKTYEVNRVEIVFDNQFLKPIIYVDAGEVKFEDRSFNVDTHYVLKKISELEYRKKDNLSYPKEFSQTQWKLMINNEVQAGDFEVSHFVSEIKKIIRYETILNVINEKVAKYLK